MRKLLALGLTLFLASCDDPVGVKGVTCRDLSMSNTPNVQTFTELSECPVGWELFDN